MKGSPTIISRCIFVRSQSGLFIRQLRQGFCQVLQGSPLEVLPFALIYQVQSFFQTDKVPVNINKWLYQILHSSPHQNPHHSSHLTVAKNRAIKLSHCVFIFTTMSALDNAKTAGATDRFDDLPTGHARGDLERRLLWKLDLRMSIIMVIYILNYVSLSYFANIVV